MARLVGELRSVLDLEESRIDLTEAEARESVAVAKRGLEAAAEEIVRQISGRAWIALGYQSWDEMREAEYRGPAVIVPRAGRPEIVAKMRNEGLSQEAIGRTLGVAESTIRNDVRNIADAPSTRTDSLGRQQPTSKPHTAPMLTEEQVRAIQDRRDIEAARLAAQAVVTDVRTRIVTILTGARLGEPDLISTAMVRELREAIDLLEGEL